MILVKQIESLQRGVFLTVAADEIMNLQLKS